MARAMSLRQSLELVAYNVARRRPLRALGGMALIGISPGNIVIDLEPFIGRGATRSILRLMAFLFANDVWDKASRAR